jgi:hypothetical protein
MKSIVFLFLAICGFALMGCNPALAEEGSKSQQVNQDTQKTLNDTGKYLHEKKANYAKRIRVELDDLKSKIKIQERKLSSGATHMGKDVEKNLRQQVRDLHRQEKVLEAELRRVQKSGEKDLDGLKADIDHDMNKLKKGYDDLLEGMKVK